MSTFVMTCFVRGVPSGYSFVPAMNSSTSAVPRQLDGCEPSTRSTRYVASSNIAAASANRPASTRSAYVVSSAWIAYWSSDMVRLATTQVRHPGGGYRTRLCGGGQEWPMVQTASLPADMNWCAVLEHHAKRTPDKVF